jgi:hypothetical protein
VTTFTQAATAGWEKRYFGLEFNPEHFAFYVPGPYVITLHDPPSCHTNALFVSHLSSASYSMPSMSFEGQ